MFIVSFLTDSINTICNAFTSGACASDQIQPSLSKNLQTLLFEFSKAFKARKVPD